VALARDQWFTRFAVVIKENAHEYDCVRERGMGRFADSRGGKVERGKEDASQNGAQSIFIAAIDVC